MLVAQTLSVSSDQNFTYCLFLLDYKTIDINNVFSLIKCFASLIQFGVFDDAAAISQFIPYAHQCTSESHGILVAAHNVFNCLTQH